MATAVSPAIGVRPAAGSGSAAWRRFRRNRLALWGAAIVFALLVVAMFAPRLAPQDPARQHLSDRLAPPSARYWLGADEFGRDILSRLVFGSRVALSVSTGSIGLALVTGLVIGTFSGYAGGITDETMMRVMDLLLAFPYLLLALAIVSVLGPGLANIVVAVAIWATPGLARVVRGAVLSVKSQVFVEAARALGATHDRIVRSHVLPNIIAPVVVYASLYMANAILLEAALSFLGLGIQPPAPSWGLMVSRGRDFLLVAPHVSTIPGLAIALAVLGFNLLGDGLRDALDPKLRDRF